ncbi:response regulator receiver domain-containing protein [Gillisia sp. Hel_I_86]|uniref:response regulator n=1 Tax=Gillisia sp. Hel_I_86 TaxID=1249981 RepID=UPI00119BBE52|nr:response regulator [Gillisia sp. Hel_I_86]TVZ28706.1 response regulator receiver domain-containing protein [Gillisia sp. Hel_I_86]
MRKALVIQEDIIILKILERLVMLNHYECKAIGSINDLNIEDQSENFDIIISDILFDGIAPLDFVFQIQEIILHQSLIIVTNMGQKKIKKEIMASENVSGFFAIPLDMDHIQTLIA